MLHIWVEFGREWSIKRSLGVILLSDNVVLTDYTLMTVLTEVESMVNSRPLTRVSDDVNDLEALTPNHFDRESLFELATMCDGKQ